MRCEVLMAFEASPQRAVGRSCVVVSGGPAVGASGGASEVRARCERKKLEKAGETVVRRESVALSQ